jgi:hypothetical protein
MTKNQEISTYLRNIFELSKVFGLIDQRFKISAYKNYNFVHFGLL